MGRTIAKTLLAEGNTVTVWNRTPDKADDLVQKGARRAASAAEVIAASPITLICINDYPAVHAVLVSADDALSGRALVNLTSGTPKEARVQRDWVTGRGADYLDGVILVPPPLVGKPESVFLYSGAREVFDAHRPTLTVLGEPRYLGGDPGSAVLYNVALLDLMYATMNGFLHATALIDTADANRAEFIDLALKWFMPDVVVGTLAEYAPALGSGSYPGDLGTMHVNRNALDHITRTSAEQGIHTDQPALMRTIADRAIAAGRGGENYLAVYEVFKKP